jgi:cell division protein FtsQ
MVNKKWPNSLQIKIIEHKAVAVWNNDKLLNEQGKIFQVDSVDDLSTLPQINGKDSNSQQIWNKFIRFNNIVKNTGFEIESSTVSNRGGWNLYLSNGININLGSQLIDARLVRLTETWTKLLQQRQDFPHYIDLRYTNGYVAKWPHNTIIEPIDKQQGTGTSHG